MIGRLATFLAAILMPTTAASEADISPAERASALADNVVLIEVTWSDDESERGLGFVVGQGENELFIVTANHTLRRDDPTEAKPEIQVETRLRHREPVTGRLVRIMDDDLDLGVVAIDINDGPDWVSEVLEPRSDALSPGAPVWFVAEFGDGRLDGSARAGAVRRINALRHEIVTEIDIAAATRGVSGAPLISERGIVGMIVRDAGTEGTIAIDIAAIRTFFDEHRLPWSLSSAPVLKNMVDFAAGDFIRGAEGPWLEDALALLPGVDMSAVTRLFANAGPRKPVRLRPFALDRHEVSWGDFRAFAAESDTISLPDGFADDVVSDDHPVVGVTWTEADAYCRARNKRLPTEAEWERAARGSDGRVFAWGDAIDLNDDIAYCRSCPLERTALASARPVATAKHDRTPEGLHDLGGNVREWVSDWYSSTFYAEPLVDGPENLTESEYRVVRGGSWRHGPEFLIAFMRSGEKPGRRDATIGFRCASSEPD